LTLPDEQRRRLSDALSPDERARADRYAHRLAREQFVCARALLRQILSRYLDHPPNRIRIECSGTGKPLLPGRPLHFNVSHSGDLALIAITRRGEVGVDVERVRSLPSYLEMAARYFTPGETAALFSLPAGLSEEAFFHVWTRKEAFLKALGLGLSHGLERFEVSVPPDDPARVLHIDGDRRAGTRWSLCALHPAPTYVAALAIEGRDLQVVHRRWENEARS
jgi:4'-phosphopantetheinyl transferase